MTFSDLGFVGGAETGYGGHCEILEAEVVVGEAGGEYGGLVVFVFEFRKKQKQKLLKIQTPKQIPCPKFIVYFDLTFTKATSFLFAPIGL